jgi:hypothetical protein
MCLVQLCALQQQLCLIATQRLCNLRMYQHSRIILSTKRRQEAHLYVDYKSDESYTPSRLSIRAGSAYHDLKVNSSLTYVDWQHLPVVSYSCQQRGCLCAHAYVGGGNLLSC